MRSGSTILLREAEVNAVPPGVYNTLAAGADNAPT
jgi:hypothetical protein